MVEIFDEDVIPLAKPLTDREQEILALLADGLSNREIAERLVLALSTIKWYNRQLYAKLGVENRQQAVSRARKLGLLPNEDTDAVLPYNLPATITPFVGRVDELKQIVRMLIGPDCRLLTLVGPGGSGKTRLAIQATSEVAHTHLSCFSDGIYYVSLIPATDTDSLVRALTRALGLTHGDDIEPYDQLLTYLRNKRLLLVLDNYEHLMIEDGARLPVDILRRETDIKLLITSRTRLNIKGEQLFTVHGMRRPSVDSITGQTDLSEETESFSAIQLFVDSARRIRPQFSLTEDNVCPVVRLCDLVDGMPLGIILAAGWMEVLSPQEILAEVEQHLDFLDADWDDLAERHRSLRAVFETSWRLLSEEERSVLSKLSIFRGGFRREAAVAVGGATTKTLLTLTNKSWLQQDQRGYFHIHEMLRHYANELLRSNETIWKQTRSDHASFFTAYLRQQYELMWGPDQRQAFENIAIEFENVVVAWHYLISLGQFDILIDDILPPLHANSIAHFQKHGFRTLVDAALRSDTGNDLRIAIWLTAKNVCRLETIRIHALRSEAQRAWEITDGLENGLVIGLWSSYLALVYASIIDRGVGEERFRILIDHLRVSEDRRTLALTLMLFGFHLDDVGELDEAERMLSEAHALYTAAGVPLERIRTFCRLARLKGRDYANARAIQMLRSVLVLAEDEGDRFHSAYVWAEIGGQHLLLGDLKAAKPHLAKAQHYAMILGQHEFRHWMVQREVHGETRYGDVLRAKELWHSFTPDGSIWGTSGFMPWHAWEMGEIYRLMGDLDIAVRLFQETLPYFEQSGSIMGVAYYHRGVGDVARMRGEHAKAKEAYETSLALLRSVDHIWTMSYVLSGMGKLAIDMGEYEQALAYLAEALVLADKWGHRDLALKALAGYGMLFDAMDEPHRAAEICTFVANNPASWKRSRKEARSVLLALGVELEQDADVSQEELDVKLKSLITLLAGGMESLS